MTPLEVLTATRALIGKPEHWCQHKSMSWDAETDEITQHCLTAAINSAAQERADIANPVFIILQQLSDPNIKLTHFNDTHTHAEVIGLLDQAIEELRG